MKSIASKARPRTTWLAVMTLCGMALTTSAHAQFSGVQQVGTPLGIPMSSLGQFYAQNLIRGNNVNFLTVTQTAIGPMNSQIAVVGVTQRNGAPASMVYVPKWALPAVKQINNNKTIVEQTAVGTGNTQVAQVEVEQTNSVAVPRGTRYLFCPSWAAGPLVQLNNNCVIVTQVAIGNGNTQAAVIGVTQRNRDRDNDGNPELNVPAGAASGLVQLNNNVTVVTQVAVGDGNTQVATVEVSQNNR